MDGKDARKCVVKVMVTPYEKVRIASNAEACGLSISSYTRALLVDHNPVYKNDLEDMKKLFKLHADQGRLGGLLKMLLTNDERLNDMGRDMATVTIDNVLLDIRKTQDLLRQEVERLLHKGAPQDD